MAKLYEGRDDHLVCSCEGERWTDDGLMLAERTNKGEVKSAGSRKRIGESGPHIGM